MNKLGIIGGISWHSTALLYEAINRDIAARLGGLHSARLVIESLDLAPIAAMQQAGDWEGVECEAVAAAARLKAAGAEALLLGSNTMHRVADAVAAKTGSRVLHIGDAIGDAVARDGRRRVALLGTRFTMREPFVRERIEARGVTLATLPRGAEERVDRIIYEELATGRIVRESQRQLRSLISELAKQKVEAVILGCTELVLAVDVRANVLPVYDSTAIYGRAAADWILSDEAANEPAAAAAA